MYRLRAVIQAGIVAGAILGGAAMLGLSVRVFLWASGLGG